MDKITLTQKEIEDACLRYQPFEGDDTDTTELKNTMVTTRKHHNCQGCLATIKPKTRCRALTERNDEERTFITFYFCPLCCRAMAKVELHCDESELDYRESLAWKRRQKRDN